MRKHEDTIYYFILLMIFYISSCKNPNHQQILLVNDLEQKTNLDLLKISSIDTKEIKKIIKVTNFI